MACGENYYRKPHSGAYTLYENHYNIKINKRKSFFCGDALGREGDFSDSDYNFGHNNGLKVYTPENFFVENKLKVYKYENIKYEKFLKEIISNKNKKSFLKLIEKINNIKSQKLIVMNGSVASGKSTFSSYISSKYDYVRCESDILKNKLYENVKKELINNNNVIVDGTNSMIKMREKYIKMAKDVNKNIVTILIYIPYNEDLIRHMYHYRIEKSKNENKVIPEIVLRIYKSKYEEVSKSEKFDYIFEYNPYIFFTNESDKKDFMKHY
jgi:bifunctional polynucleotide phosphatase/kinase